MYELSRRRGKRDVQKMIKDWKSAKNTENKQVRYMKQTHLKQTKKNGKSSMNSLFLN